MINLDFSQNKILKFKSVPKPISIEKVDNFYVLRDDLISGGTKRRILYSLLKNINQKEIVYSSCQYGQGHVALAQSGLDLNKKVTLFYPKYNEFTDSFYNTTENLKANYFLIGNDQTSQIEIDLLAREYALQKNALHIPIGFAFNEFENEIIKLAKSLPFSPKEVWALAGSGTLVRALIKAWPNAQINAVSLGLDQCNTENAKVFYVSEDLREPADILPPYPSNIFYDAKIWRFVKLFASDDALIWNVS